MREVDEAVRQDEVTSFAKKYGWPIGIAFVVGMAAFGGILLWQDHSEGELEAESEAIIAAFDELEAGNADIADEELAALADSDSVGPRSVSALARAGIALQEGRIEDGVALYEGVAADAEAPQAIRDLATLRLVLAQYDDMQPQQVIDRLGPLAVPDNAYFGSAGELVAIAYLAQEKPEKAGPLLASIAKDENVPNTLRSRTRQLAGVLGYDAIEDVEKTLAEVGGGAAPAAPQLAQ